MACLWSIWAPPPVLHASFGALSITATSQEMVSSFAIINFLQNCVRRGNRTVWVPSSQHWAFATLTRPFSQVPVWGGGSYTICLFSRFDPSASLVLCCFAILFVGFVATLVMSAIVSTRGQEANGRVVRIRGIGWVLRRQSYALEWS